MRLRQRQRRSTSKKRSFMTMQGKISHGARERAERELASAAAQAAARPLTGIERAAVEVQSATTDWREEVASHVQNYRTRRRKYNPDLCLPLQFEEQRRA